MSIFSGSKKLAAVALFGAVTTLSSSAQAGLIMTGLIDGPLTGGTPKAVEFYASTAIADASIYNLELVSNAGSRVGIANGINFPAVPLAAGSYFYISTESPNFTAVFGFAPDLLNNEVNHNGDDDFYLYESGVLIDAWGGSDALDNTSTAYDILDSWAYRLNNTGPSATFDVFEWTIAPVDSLDGLSASQTNDAVPFGTFIVPEPASLGLIGIGALAMLRRRRSTVA